VSAQAVADAPTVAGGPAPWTTTLSDTAALAGRRLQHLRRAPGKLIGITMNPLVTLFVIGYIFKHAIVVPAGVHYQTYLMAGIAAQVGLASIGPSAIGVAVELNGGIIERLRSLPTARLTILIGHTISDLLVSCVSLAIVFAAGYLMGWRPDNIAGTVAAFGVILAFIYVMVWVGVLLGMTMRDVESIEPIGAVILVLFSFLSNAFISVSTLPGWIQPLARWNPVSAVASLCRDLWGAQSGGMSAGHAGMTAAAWLGAILLIAVAISVRGYRTSAAR
jgi:ABC-2 type transport system permease protein